MKFLGTGLSGLVGSRVVSLLSTHTFINYSLESGVDITDRETIMRRITADTEATWVLHFAAYTNVQQAESDKDLGEKSPAWQVNVAATQSIVDACRASGKHLLYIDTDYAFDGTRDRYTEDDPVSPLGWYAKTKSEGAKRVLALDSYGTVIRISNPYRAHPVGKKDFVHKMMERLSARQEIVAPADQLFVPTFIDDIAGAIEKLVAVSASGIYHVTGTQAISPFDAAYAVAETFGHDAKLVKPVSFAEYFAGKAPVPQKAVLATDKIRALGVTLHGFNDGIAEVKKQEEQTAGGKTV